MIFDDLFRTLTNLDDFLQTCMHACMHAWMHAWMPAWMHAWTHALLHALLHASMHASIKNKTRYQAGPIISCRQKKTTIRHSSTISETWCYPQPRSCSFQTKFISILDKAHIKIRRSLYQV